VRRVLQRANERLGTNWSLHDARHTAAARMAGDERLTLAEVQTILRHAHLDTTGHYLVARIEDMHDKLQEHYARPWRRAAPTGRYRRWPVPPRSGRLCICWPPQVEKFAPAQAANLVVPGYRLGV
jgi:hypothetical protein